MQWDCSNANGPGVVAHHLGVEVTVASRTCANTSFAMSCRGLCARAQVAARIRARRIAGGRGYTKPSAKTLKKKPIPLPRLATVLVWVRREFSVTLPIARQSENGSEGHNTFVYNRLVTISPTLAIQTDGGITCIRKCIHRPKCVRLSCW